MIELFISALALGFLFNAVPGAIFTESLRRGLQGGYKSALYVQFGSLVGDLISKFDFLKCEVSKVEMYKGGTKFKDLDNFLKNNQFKLSSHPYWRVPDHGDVLYSKNKV